MNTRAGAIPASIGNLTNLQELWLRNNKISSAFVESDIHKNSRRKVETRLGIARAGPPLPETLRLLAPLAPTLKKLDLSLNKLGGAITDDVAAFTKLTELGLAGMGLEGAFVEPGLHKNSQAHAQAPSRRRSATSRSSRCSCSSRTSCRVRVC